MHFCFPTCGFGAEGASFVCRSSLELEYFRVPICLIHHNSQKLKVVAKRFDLGSNNLSLLRELSSNNWSPLYLAYQGQI